MDCIDFDHFRKIGRACQFAPVNFAKQNALRVETTGGRVNSILD